MAGVAVTPPHRFPPATPIAGGQEVRSRLGRFKGGREPTDTQQGRGRVRSHPTGDPAPTAMGQGRLRLGLACCLLLLLLGGSGGLGSQGVARGPWEEEQGSVAEGGPWGRARYEAVKKHLGAVSALSKQYWQYLACKVWQQGCEEEEESSPRPGWSLPLVGQDYLEILSAWYCSFGKCCKTGDCRVVNNITGLEADLQGQLHGQHLAKEVVVQAVRGFLQSPRPEKPLVLSFHGWSGTGKNFVARMVASHLYRDGMKSECVRLFISLFHFPHHKYVDSYKAQLKKQISETLQLCKQSLFIFDEAEKLHFSLLDAIKPFMAHYDNEGQVDSRRSIFLFLSNLGGNTINEVALDFWRAGRAREEISMEFLEQRLRLELQESAARAPSFIYVSPAGGAQRCCGGRAHREGAVSRPCPLQP
ncbi:torsin-3A isoform X2 [Chroicocephalus ridibundus]|uniref:torsin-3A isoform X2 n=1 Tax=Chroicocephalus ridibundus TaxID=1192867 RepID=UPI002FDE04CF